MNAAKADTDDRTRAPRDGAGISSQHERLSTQDAAFLDFERPRQRLAVACVAEIDGPLDPDHPLWGVHPSREPDAGMRLARQKAGRLPLPGRDRELVGIASTDDFLRRVAGAMRASAHSRASH